MAAVADSPTGLTGYVAPGEGKQVEVTKSKRSLDGSCNGCQRRDEETVYVIEFKTTVIRLCSDCKTEFIYKLKQAT